MHGVRRASLLVVCVAALCAADEPAPAPPPEPRLIGPRTGPEKAKALTARGGSAATEKAVAAGLDWLARHAEPGGGWDADGFPDRCAAVPGADGKACTGVGRGQHDEEVPCPFDDAIGGLATLAFLGAGHLPGKDAGPYGELVEKALQRLERGGGDRWALAIGTEALAEAEAMEGRGRWRESVRRNVDALLAARQEDGGWGYVAPWRAGSDVPYTALVVPALLAARDAGVELPTDLAPRIDAWLSSLEEDEGRLAYLKDGRKYGYTPTTSNAHCAAALRELLQVGTSLPRHRAHMGRVAEEAPVWKISFREKKVPGRGVVQVQIGNLSMYQWWYGTIATFHAGGTAWDTWSGKLRTALLGHQEKTGCARGSWPPVGLYERRTGRVFATAMGVLMLEQPYRQRRQGR